MASPSTVVHIDETIITETPDTGIVRLKDKSYSYSSHGTSSFVVGTGVEESYIAGDNAYVPYMEKTATGATESVSIVHATDRNIKVRVRKKGILPFEVDSSFTSTGVTVAAIRTTDEIVD